MATRRWRGKGGEEERRTARDVVRLEGAEPVRVLLVRRRALRHGGHTADVGHLALPHFEGEGAATRGRGARVGAEA